MMNRRLPSTTGRTKKTIHLMQADGTLSDAEEKRIKEKYFRVISAILRAKLTQKISDNEIEIVTHDVINDVFADIGSYRWSFKFRQFIYKKIETKFWERIHELEKKEIKFSEMEKTDSGTENGPLDFPDIKTTLEAPSGDLPESDKKDIVLKIVKEFVLPELKTKNETYYRILTLKTINEWEHPEIATELNISVVNSRKGLQLARAQFLKLLKQYLEQIPFVDKSLYDTKRLMKILPLLIK
ncbi:MAG: hypothetical protein V1871_00760 [Planctomycetota bacterium]